MSIQRKSTQKVELVETHNIYLSIERITNSGGDWKRSLYHALLMANAPWREHVAKIREAIQLP